MHKLFYLTAALLVAVCSFCPEQLSALDKKQTKLAAKEAKKLEKEGWKTMNLPIQTQLEETWEMQAQRDEDGFKSFIVKEVVAISNSYSAAQSQAENIAKIRIAGDIGSSVASLTDIALKNEEISAADAATVAKIAEEAKVLVSQELGRIVTGQTLYRITPENKYEVRVVVLYNMRKAMQLAHDVMMQQMQNEISENAVKVMNGVLGSNNLIGAYEESGFDEIL